MRIRIRNTDFKLLGHLGVWGSWGPDVLGILEGVVAGYGHIARDVAVNFLTKYTIMKYKKK